MDGDSRRLLNCAELKHLNGVPVSTTHDMLYDGNENLYQVWCGALCETSIPSFVSIKLSSSYPYIVCMTVRNKPYTTSLLFSLSILRIGTSNGVKTPSAINQSFRLDKNYIMLKYLQLKEYARRPANLQPLSGRKRCDFTVLQ